MSSGVSALFPLLVEFSRLTSITKGEVRCSIYLVYCVVNDNYYVRAASIL
jgi:hypothetical protein